jgi:hypothetical protein
VVEVVHVEQNRKSPHSHALTMSSENLANSKGVCVMAVNQVEAVIRAV